MRRRALRKQAERGCSVYIPAEVLQAVGIDPAGPPPFYRTWPGPKRTNPTVLVKLYQEA
jgi:hypothetical protein